MPELHDGPEQKSELMRIRARDAPAGLASPSAAIRSAKATSDSYLQSLDFRRLIGRQIESVEFDHGRLCCSMPNLSMPNLPSLSILATSSGVSLEMGRKTVTGTHQPILELQLGTRRWTWNRGGIANQLIGQTIRNGFYTGIDFYLYLENGTAISFCSFTNEASLDSFLYWDVAV